jgi:hypothetical protein
VVAHNMFGGPLTSEMGSKGDLTALKCDFRYTTRKRTLSGHGATSVSCQNRKTQHVHLTKENESRDEHTLIHVPHISAAEAADGIRR